jgi:hypothetical protein
MEGQTFYCTRRERGVGVLGVLGVHTGSSKQTARDQNSCVVSKKYGTLRTFVGHPKINR